MYVHQVTLITGRTKDIGLAAATALAGAKARVLILAEKEDEGDDALQHIRTHCRESGNGTEPDVAYLECNFASLTDVKRVADAICAQESRLDIVRIHLRHTSLLPHESLHTFRS